MAFRFWTSKYTTTFKTTGLSDKESWIIAFETIQTLKWEIDSFHESNYHIVAITGFSWQSFGEEITINIDNGTITIKSKCLDWQFTDYGKNKKNATRFISTFNILKEELSQADIKAKLAEIEKIIKSASSID